MSLELQINKMAMTDKESNNFDPGAMRFGNFINYYQFHPPLERIKLLTSQIWQQLKLDGDPIVCLDLGCNCGDLTESLYENIQKNMNCDDSNSIKLLGIDIDSTLIARAVEKNKFKQNISFECLNIMEPSATEYLDAYLTRKKNNGVTENTDTLISNEVESSDTPTDKTAQKLLKFDIVFCFSVTMWIHLNHGDEGLLKFLEKIASLGKYIVLENQLWKCYRNAQRRLVKNASKEKRSNVHIENLEEKQEGSDQSQECTSSSQNESKTKTGGISREAKRIKGRKNKGGEKESEEVGFKHYKELKLRSNVDKDIDKYLMDKCRARKMYESEPNEWGRVITVYEIV